MDAVHKQLADTGDLADMKLPGAEVAAAGRSLYASRTVNGQCVVYGAIAGKDIEPQADSTGQACDPYVPKALQTQFDGADADKRNAAVSYSSRS